VSQYGADEQPLGIEMDSRDQPVFVTADVEDVK
jgi:hypothetical protein